ncbi:acyl-CoA N-acyltransferase [Auriculariales sp. MPI-PUGE-AT-0066]|nr:acyl-CoA N-acyltransferase [Auriculariales sp. MPI-PUGE-AT-0066]
MLSNKRLRLEALDTSRPIHFQLVNDILATPELSNHLRWQHWPDIPAFMQWSTTLDVWAIIPNIPENDGQQQQEGATRPRAAGIVCLIPDVPNKAGELGLLVLPAWQRTFVSGNAIGVLMQHCFAPLSQGGLGLRRTEWRATTLNEGSVRLAKRLGFKQEAILRWQSVLPFDKDGEHRPGMEHEHPGRHTVVLAVCWEDWEEGAFQHALQAQMQRVK